MLLYLGTSSSGAQAPPAGVPPSAGIVAVLPFALSGNQPGSPGGTRWIGTSIAQRIRDDLDLQGFEVVPRPLLEDAYQQLGLAYGAQLTLGSIVQLGQAMHADRILHGTFTITLPEPNTAPAVSAASELNISSIGIQGRVMDLTQLRQSEMFSTSGSLTNLIALESHTSWLAYAAIAEGLPVQAGDTGAWRVDEERYRSAIKPRRLDAEELFARALLPGPAPDRESYLRRALEVDPDFHPAALELGRLMMELRRYQAAIEVLRLLEPTDPHFLEAVFLLGAAQLESGDAKEAQASYNILVQVQPTAEAYNNLGIAESRQDLPFAASTLDRALRGDPEDIDYNFNLGYMLWKTGQYEAATERFAHLLNSTAPPDPNSAFGRNTRLLWERSLQQTGPSDSLGDSHFENLERVKTSYPFPARPIPPLIQ